MATTEAPPAPPTLLLADHQGVRLSDGRRYVDGEAVRVAAPDLMGGVVYQRPQGEITDLRLDEELGRNVWVWGARGPEPIWHVAGPGAPPTVLVDHRDANLQLVDVVEVNGRPHVLYRMVIGGPGRATAAWLQVLEWLHLFDLTSGQTRVLGLVGSWDSSRNDIRIGADLVSIARDEFGSGSGTAVGMVELGRFTEPVSQRWLPNLVLDDLRFGPRQECGADTDCWARWAVATAAHDGSRLTWLEGVWDDGTTTLVLKAAARLGSEERLLADLGQATMDTWHDLSLDDDGTWVALGGRQFPGVTLVGPAGMEQLEEPVSSVRIWRNTATTTTDLTAEDLGVTLRNDGLGSVAFGMSLEDTVAVLEEVLGPHSRSWDGFFHSYRWDWLGLTLSFHPESVHRSDGVEHLVAWGQEEGLGASLRTSGGVGVGDTYAKLISAHASEISTPAVPDECMPEWFVWLGDSGPGGLVIVLDAAPGPDARITWMRAGMSESC